MIFSLAGCSCSSNNVVELKKFSMDTMDGIITRSGVEIDKNISIDGNGSLRINAMTPTVVKLFEIDGLKVQNARLIFQAKVRTDNVNGQVYLAMWCSFPGKGEFFSRNLETPVTGTTDWTTEETIFLLRKGEKTDRVKLNIVINGKGTVWVDDVRLLLGSLK